MTTKKELHSSREMSATEAAAFDRFARESGRYLASMGWIAVVAGPALVQQQPDESGSMRFELVLRFTGRKIEEERA